MNTRSSDSSGFIFDYRLFPNTFDHQVSQIVCHVGWIRNLVIGAAELSAVVVIVSNRIEPMRSGDIEDRQVLQRRRIDDVTFPASAMNELDFSLNA